MKTRGVLSVLLSITVVLMAAAAALAQSAGGQKPAETPKKGSSYESDPGKYVDEPTKNMEPGEGPDTGPAPKTPTPSPADVAGLAQVLKRLPEGTRHQFVMMRLRDGVKLATDVFLPPEGNGPWPTVLLRTQYSRWDGRGMNAMKGTPCALVLQNIRGRYGSEGAGTYEAINFTVDVNDGSDTLNWIAKQKWSNGKVGMWGPSGHGIAAINAMWSLNPHLTVVDVNVTCDNAYLYFVYSNGARRFLYSWLGQRNLNTGRDEWPRPTAVAYDPETYFSFIREKAPKVKTFYRINAGWFDVFSEAALDHFAVLAPYGRTYAQMGPGGHGKIGGDLEFKARNQFPREAMKLARGLKECLAGPTPEPSKSCLAYYLMGDTKDKSAPGNVWMTTDKWPVDHKAVSYYMQADGGLTLKGPTDRQASLSYDYDPKNPLPTLGGNYDVSDPKRLQIGPLDQRPQAGRKDVLRFKSAPLTEPVGITGKVWAELHISSDRPDTMFVGRLVDIYPDGYEAIIRESAILARYWQGWSKPAPIEKGGVYKLSMDMWSTALVFGKGHRIAIYISSSSEPSYEVHPNTYDPVASIAEARVAHNTVHLSAGHASRLILPVVPPQTYMNAAGDQR